MASLGYAIPKKLSDEGKAKDILRANLAELEKEDKELKEKIEGNRNTQAQVKGMISGKLNEEWIAAILAGKGEMETEHA